MWIDKDKDKELGDKEEDEGHGEGPSSSWACYRRRRGLNGRRWTGFTRRRGALFALFRPSAACGGAPLGTVALLLQRRRLGEGGDRHQRGTNPLLLVGSSSIRWRALAATHNCHTCGKVSRSDCNTASSTYFHTGGDPMRVIILKTIWRKDNSMATTTKQKQGWPL